MNSGLTSLRFERKINAPVKHVFRAFTTQAALEDWLCSTATVDSSQPTKLYLWWDRGYYMSGEYLKLTPDKEIIFSWLGRNDPGKTRVRVTIKKDGVGCALTLEHRGIKTSAKWQATLEEMRRGWESGLDNLVSILETGRDMRILKKPMLGVNMEDYSAEIAGKLGVPVSQGVRLGGVMEGMGAFRSGLQKDDVLVEVGGVPTHGYHSLSGILASKKAGDVIEVKYYRGKEKRTITVELSPRPAPEVPPTLAELVQYTLEMYQEGDNLLSEALKDISETEASFKPGPGEWNVREVLAHLIHNERDWHFNIFKWVANETINYPPNLQARIEATIAVYSTVTELLMAYKQAEAETIAFLRRLPEDFIAQKDSYWQIGFNQVQFNSHTKEHIEQIKAIRAAAHMHS